MRVFNTEKIELTGDELSECWVVVREPTLEDWNRAVLQRPNIQDNEAFNNYFILLMQHFVNHSLRDWNINDDEGGTLPLDMNGWNNLTANQALSIINDWIELFTLNPPFITQMEELVSRDDGYVRDDGTTTTIPSSIYNNELCIEAAKYLGVDLEKVYQNSFYMEHYFMHKYFLAIPKLNIQQQIKADAVYD